MRRSFPDDVGKSTLLRNVRAPSALPRAGEWHAFVAVWNFVSPTTSR